MAHTFDIRFARSEGLAALFEAPANRLRWKGRGLLSIDPGGISIAVKRGLLNLFSRRSRRFRADSLTEVYREGDSLRLVFTSGDRSEVLPVWAKGGDTAAEIVKLLPTLRTVELEHSTGVARRYRLDWRLLSLALIMAAVVIGLAALWRPTASDGPPTPASLPAGAEDAGDSATTAPVAEDPGRKESASPALPSRAGAAPYSSPGSTRNTNVEPDAGPAPSYTSDAQDEAASAAEASSAPASQSAVSRADAVAPPAQGMSSAEAALRLLIYFEAQSDRGIDDEGWWNFTVTVHTTPEYQHPDLWVLREAMLAVSRAWRAHDEALARTLAQRVAVYAR